MDVREFFKEKRVLITGHTGFKGAWLSQIMINSGAIVSGYSLSPNTKPNLFEILELDKHLENNIADIRDLEKVKKVVKDFKPDIIFHLAAQPIVRDSYDDPVYTYETNVMGTVNILEAIRLYEVPVGIMITTDKVYKNVEKDIAYKEDDQLGGHDPYSNSKACADLVTRSYIMSFFNPKDYKKTHQTFIASARAGNVVGGGDWAKDRLIPDAVRAFLVNDEDLIIRSPKAIRPWQHVLESLYGYILLAIHLYNGESDKVGSWNFGPQDEDMKEVEAVINKMTEHFKKGKYLIKEDTSKHEAGLLKIDNTKAKEKIGWIPKYTLDKTIKDTAYWYEAFHLKKGDMKKLTDNQIEAYFTDKI